MKNQKRGRGRPKLTPAQLYDRDCKTKISVLLGIEEIRGLESLKDELAMKGIPLKSRARTVEYIILKTLSEWKEKKILEQHGVSP